MTHTLRYAARSDRGLLRANNQDSVFAGNRLLVVADGMGGHAAGDTASRLAVAAFAPLDEFDPGGRDLLVPLEHATEDGNDAIAEMVEANPELDGMGTTLTALMFDGPRLGIAHVGDSRAYLWRAGVLSQITHDDTFVQSLIDEGRITEAEAQMHPQRSLLLRALNGSDVEPTLTSRDTRPGDRYLICSDGLSGVISAEAIADTLASYETSEAADRLIELALRGGGPDNVTVIVADVLDTGDSGDPDAAPMTADELDATGPMDSMRFTKRMPRVPLPKEPDVAELAARAEFATQAPVDDDDETDELEADELETDDHPAGRRRKWLRRLAFVAAVAALLVIGGIAGTTWVGNQYYVADDEGTVTVFRGVDGSIFGLRLSNAQEGSCLPGRSDCVQLRTADLLPAARDRVVSGIPANDLQNAREIIVRLGDQLLPPCSVFAAPPSTSSSALSTPISATQAPATQVPPEAPTTDPIATAPVADGTTVDAPGAPPSAGNPASTAATTTVSSTTLSAVQPDPGVNCRPAP